MSHRKNGLTAILVYPMNALANDQEERIEKLLKLSGHTHLSVARYDRQTSEEDRKRLRSSPPHILLTNYVMLEYPLVRPADRSALFANHRCRYIVLDEVHSYRGALGANIALLFRRLLAHLRQAEQDWRAEDRSDPVRFPTLVPVATSATIKSVDEAGRAEEEVERLRDDAVQTFFSGLTGVERSTIKVVGEKLRTLEPAPAGHHAPILWELNALLAKKPMSVAGIVAELATLPERAGQSPELIRAEVQTRSVLI